MEIGYKIKAVNHLLYTTIIKKYKTIPNFSISSGISCGSLYRYINLRGYPAANKKRGKKIINILEKTLGISAKKLFPEDLKHTIDLEMETNLYLKKEVDFKLLNFEDIKTIENKAIATTIDIELKEKKEHLYKAINKLNEREQKILKLRFGLDGDIKTYEEIGMMFGISRERIRQIEAKALKRLRHSYFFKD